MSTEKLKECFQFVSSGREQQNVFLTQLKKHLILPSFFILTSLPLIVLCSAGGLHMWWGERRGGRWVVQMKQMQKSGSSSLKHASATTMARGSSADETGCCGGETINSWFSVGLFLHKLSLQDSLRLEQHKDLSHSDTGEGVQHICCKAGQHYHQDIFSITLSEHFFK